MSTLDKLQNDYRSFIENVERTAAADIEKIRSDLNALKEKAAQFNRNRLIPFLVKRRLGLIRKKLIANLTVVLQ